MGKKLLLHVCCGPCATSSIERLLQEGYEPVLFFSDSNIFPHEEFIKRYENLLIVAESLCFRFNLERTAEKARELGIENFATTLTVSRFKNSAKIFHEGEGLSGFCPMDFKKKDGFSRSIVLSKELGLYRQDYCGCEFSLRDRRCAGS